MSGDSLLLRGLRACLGLRGKRACTLPIIFLQELMYFFAFARKFEAEMVL
jgi:hypothetical protein